MYVTEVKSQKNGKTYRSVLLRESYRENGRVKNRTIKNLTSFHPALIEVIKDFYSGNEKKEKVNFEDQEIVNSYEYGASFAFRELAKKIGLDDAIFSQKTQWRENILAMIIGRILYQGSKFSLVNIYKDTALWENAGHEYGEKPNVEKDCYEAMDELLKRKKKIECKLAKKNLNEGAILLYDITNTWFEGEYKNSEIVEYGKGKGGKVGYKQVAIGLLTNSEGCPIGVEIFKGNTSDQTTVCDQIKKISNDYGIKEAVFVGDRGMLTNKRIDEIDSEHFKIITALTHRDLAKVIKKENIQMDFFDEMNITEIVDSENKDIRYMLCKNANEEKKERDTRDALIKRVEKLLTQKAAVTRRRGKNKTCASIGRIFEKVKVEKFFNWDVDDNGKLTWTKDENKILEEQLLDGCYVIKTNVSKTMNKEEVVQAYKNLQKVEQAFKNMKTVTLELRPIHHKLDYRIKSHIFLVMLAYHLQWHAMQRLKPLFANDGKGSNKRWSFDVIIQRLKSITKFDVCIKGAYLKKLIKRPDEEQTKILELLGVRL